jgi:hypothetical protein
MANIKHVGRTITNNRRVVVAYRVVPGEPDHCIVVTTENLSADEHDTLMRVVESPAGQDAQEFALVMSRSTMPDGRNMLSHLHQTGKMIKVKTDNVEMIPNRNSSILLSELNEIIAQQKGVTVADLALSDGNTPAKPSEPVVAEPVVAEPVAQAEPLSDEELARQLRSQADAMFKEAKALREQAESLSPTKRTTKKKEVESEST